MQLHNGIAPCARVESKQRSFGSTSTVGSSSGHRAFSVSDTVHFIDDASIVGFSQNIEKSCVDTPDMHLLWVVAQRVSGDEKVCLLRHCLKRH